MNQQAKKRRRTLIELIEKEGGHARFIARHGLTAADSSYISQIVNGYSFGEKSAEKWCQRLGLPEGYFTSSDSLASVPNDHRKIPILSSICPGGVKKQLLEYQMGKVELPECALDNDYSDSAFALSLHDESMMPQFALNDIVIIDPEVEARPGDFVLALTNVVGDIFRLYRVREISSDKKLHFDLCPLNESYPTIKSDSIECLITGVMVEHRRRRKPI